MANAAGQNPADISGMGLPEAKAYVADFIAALNIAEKQAAARGEEAAAWRKRLDLARLKGQDALAQAAEQEAERTEGAFRQLAAETGVLLAQIDTMKRQLPLLAASGRSIDPDLLEQELLAAAGHLPGDGERVRASRLLREMETAAAVDTALAELKQKMTKEQL